MNLIERLRKAQDDADTTAISHYERDRDHLGSECQNRAYLFKEAADRLSTLEGREAELCKIINDNEYDPLPHVKQLSMLEEAQARISTLEGENERLKEVAQLVVGSMSVGDDPVHAEIKRRARQALSDPQSNPSRASAEKLNDWIGEQLLKASSDPQS